MLAPLFHSSSCILAILVSSSCCFFSFCSAFRCCPASFLLFPRDGGMLLLSVLKWECSCSDVMPRVPCMRIDGLDGLEGDSMAASFAFCPFYVKPRRPQPQKVLRAILLQASIQHSKFAASNNNHNNNNNKSNHEWKRFWTRQSRWTWRW